MGGHGCDLNAKGRGDAFIPDDVTIGIGREFRTAQMITTGGGLSLAPIQTPNAFITSFARKFISICP